MKKYVKPVITLEHYELSQNIAACAWQMNSGPNENGCFGTPTDSDWGSGMTGTLFGSSGCTFDANLLEDYCYQNGSDGPFSVFGS